MNIGSVIPQIFYDLIARITPGLVVIMTGLFVWRGDQATAQDVASISNWFAKDSTPVTLILFALLFAAYILAFMLDGIWWLLPKKFSSKLSLEGESKHVKEILSDFEILDSNFDATNYQFPSIALRYDAVRLRDANAGARLAKLRAELHMCRVLILGLSILGVLNLGKFYWSGFNCITSISEFVIIVGVAAFIQTHGRLRERFIWGSCNHWLLLVQPGSLIEDKTVESQETAKVNG